MCRHVRPALAALFLLARGGADAYAAGGHFDVDDATVLDPGHCQYETWIARTPSEATTLSHVGPACRVGPVEMGLAVDRVERAGAGGQGAESDRRTWLGPQLKWVVDPLFERVSVGAAWSASFDVTHGGSPTQTFYVPVTWWAAEKLWVHANAGADWAAWGARTRRLGASVEWAASDRFTLIAERVTIAGDRTARLGARWTPTSSISIDLSAARIGPGGSHVFAIGLSQDFSR